MASSVAMTPSRSSASMALIVGPRAVVEVVVVGRRRGGAVGALVVVLVAGGCGSASICFAGHRFVRRSAWAT